ncbi:hypothetical protein ACFFQF_01760 [Haladaptatus pallidirubidus]
MNLPKLTTPRGVFDYILGLIIVLSVLVGLYVAAVMAGVITPWF